MPDLHRVRCVEKHYTGLCCSCCPPIVGTIVGTTPGVIYSFLPNNPTRSGEACIFQILRIPKLFHQTLLLLRCAPQCLTRMPLAATTRPFLGFPVVFEQIEKVGVVPHRWPLRPLPFESTSKRIGPNAEFRRTGFTACSRPRSFRSIQRICPGSCGAWAVELPWRPQRGWGLRDTCKGQEGGDIIAAGEHGGEGEEDTQAYPPYRRRR